MSIPTVLCFAYALRKRGVPLHVKTPIRRGGGGCRLRMGSVTILVHGCKGHRRIVPCVPVDLRAVVQCTDTRLSVLSFIDRYSVRFRQLLYTIFRASKEEVARESTVRWRVQSTRVSASLSHSFVLHVDIRVLSIQGKQLDVYSTISLRWLSHCGGRILYCLASP